MPPRSRQESKYCEILSKDDFDKYKAEEKSKICDFLDYVKTEIMTKCFLENDLMTTDFEAGREKKRRFDRKTPYIDCLFTEYTIINYWVPCITHLTVSLEDGKNYDVLEYMGDKYYGACFVNYAKNRFPNKKQLFYTELQTVYTANDYISSVTREIGLERYILGRGMPSIPGKIRADVFESFCAAIKLSCEHVINGTGEIALNNFITYVFDDVKKEDFQLGTRALGGYNTQFDQIFTRFGLKTPQQTTFTSKTSEVTVSVNLKNEHIQFLLRYTGINRVKHYYDNPIGTATSERKNEAKEQAYKNALSALEKEFKVNTRWAEEKKLDQLLNLNSIRPYKETLLRYMNEMGYEKIAFIEPPKATFLEGFTIILAGVNDRGEKESLFAHYYIKSSGQAISKDLEDARLSLVKAFLEEKRREASEKKGRNVFQNGKNTKTNSDIEAVFHLKRKTHSTDQKRGPKQEKKRRTTENATREEKRTLKENEEPIIREKMKKLVVIESDSE